MKKFFEEVEIAVISIDDNDIVCNASDYVDPGMED